MDVGVCLYLLGVGCIGLTWVVAWWPWSGRISRVNRRV